MAKQMMSITFEAETMKEMVEKVLEFLQSVGVLKQGGSGNDESGES